jgi:ComF family protein
LALGDAWAGYFAEYARRLDWLVYIMTAVPLGRQRLAERGYNQVALVARPLAAILGKRYSSKILIRVRDTRSQVGLTPEERKENVAGAFHADANLASGRNILVVDDVTTTGATLASCAESLTKAGAKSVNVLAPARALPRHGFQIV